MYDRCRLFCDSGRTEIWWHDICQRNCIVFWYGCCVCGVLSKKWGVFNNTLDLTLHWPLPYSRIHNLPLFFYFQFWGLYISERMSIPRWWRKILYQNGWRRNYRGLGEDSSFVLTHEAFKTAYWKWLWTSLAPVMMFVSFKWCKCKIGMARVIYIFTVSHMHITVQQLHIDASGQMWAS